MRFVDSLLNRITMYHLLLYYLIALLALATAFSVFGFLHFDPLAIIFDSLFLVGACWLYNQLFSLVFEAPSNRDSSYITALILALIITPTSSPRGALFLAAASGLAIASKYMFAIKRQHIFNPAAIAVVLTSMAAGDAASWWIGSALMLPYVIVGGLLVVRKTQSDHIVLAFLVAALGSTIFFSWLNQGSVWSNIQHLALSSGLFFLAFVMLIEPFTAPITKAKQIIYGCIVGALLPPQVHMLGVYSTPELALIIGNIFSYIVNPHFKLQPQLVAKKEIAPSTYDFIFATNKPVSFQPGQYVEWTLPHSGSDSRGMRRYFSIASSPTESDIRLGVKFYPNGSSYKRAMLEMTSQTPFIGSRLGGEFTLPHDPTQKVVFIAGGIGITPFRSMLKYLIDSNETRPVTLLYAANTGADFTYTDIIESARTKLGIKAVYIPSHLDRGMPANTKQGPITLELLRQELDDLNQLFYISGPRSMTASIRAALISLGVKRSHIKTDYFTGYA